MLMEKPHFSIDLGFCSPWGLASDCCNGGGQEEGELASQGPGTFSISITRPDACLLWRGRWENGVLVLAPPLSVCASPRLGTSIFPFGNPRQIEVVAICWGRENNSIAWGFEAHPWGLTAWEQNEVLLLTVGVTLGQVPHFSEPLFPPL